VLGVGGPGDAGEKKDGRDHAKKHPMYLSHPPPPS
jgi:hypothetical protein